MRQLILLLLTSTALQTMAWGQPEEIDSDQPRWFQIEVLFFRNLSAAAQQEEHWPEEIDIWFPEPSYQMPASRHEATSPRGLKIWQAPVLEIAEDEEVWQQEDQEQEDVAVSNPLLQYRGVADADTHLKAIKDRLQRRSDYQVLDYRAWRQPLAPDGAPVYFRVAAGKTREFYHELEGYIGFYLKRYLHVDTELWWGEYALPTRQSDSTSQANGELPSSAANTPDPAEGAESSQPETYNHRRVARAAHLKEQRRMRSDEVHYFDHPLMGVLVRISPLPETG
jgi:hypothetical protein